MFANNQSVPESDSIVHLHGVGKQIAKHLARLGIYSIHDLLFHLPLRYQDRTLIQSIRQLRVGEEAVVEGVIQHCDFPKRGRTKLMCELADETGRVHLRFFHVLTYQSTQLKPGTRLRCYSEVRVGPLGLEMVHPDFQVVRENHPIPVDAHLTPIYPATEGVSQYTLRKLTQAALTWMETTAAFSELLPEALLQSLSFPTLKTALLFVHRPPRNTIIQALLERDTLAQKRLVFEELLAHRISLLHVKQDFQLQPAVALGTAGTLLSSFLDALPFQLTQAQKKVAKEIQTDLQRSHPMLRLVQGDVGSGKTVIAAMAMLQAVEQGYQAAMMAPTELLAEQHYRVLTRWFSPLGVQVVNLAGHIKGRARSLALKEIANGKAQVVLGTHALFQDAVNFFKLALLIVDEQHRFGVHQRALFREKGRQHDFYPHQLIMTATPIPRTLAMSFYADLDCSVIDELPAGRKPIITSVVASSRREAVIARISEACRSGRQAYWVCPLIEESELLSCQAVTQAASDLKNLLPHLRIGLIHGRLKADDKETIMQAFQQGELHLLVATTVIEVGVDVPNASLMIIENAERLGLSQLHQLRGRVGRGTVVSHCVLLYEYPLSELAKERLAVMRETTDGFKIAQRDLELRGPGEVLGTKQTGALSFRVADLLRDSQMLPQVQKTAEWLMREHQTVLPDLIKRWIKEGEQYGKV